jgi:indole-3-glycerol phosphate synthase
MAHKKIEVAARKSAYSASDLEKRPFFQRPTLSLKEGLKDKAKTGIIAEFKRQSPSKGIINGHADILAVTQAYAALGASGISVLTDERFFGGSQEDMIKARVHLVPLLRKDFILDPYQIVEARSMGADVVLLIAACLTPAAVQSMARLARSLGLEVLLEVHNAQELDHICEEVDLVGVNNRDLKSFSVDLRRSEQLSRLIPADKIKITESGIDRIETVRHLKTFGFAGFLIGEQFMKEPDPAIAFASFVNQLKQGLDESKSLRNDTTRSGQKAG